MTLAKTTSKTEMPKWISKSIRKAAENLEMEGSLEELARTFLNFLTILFNIRFLSLRIKSQKDSLCVILSWQYLQTNPLIEKLFTFQHINILVKNTTNTWLLLSSKNIFKSFEKRKYHILYQTSLPCNNTIHPVWNEWIYNKRKRNRTIYEWTTIVSMFYAQFVKLFPLQLFHYLPFVKPILCIDFMNGIDFWYSENNLTG